METNSTVEERQEKDKQVLLDTLKELPIIQIACKKSGVSRATYYRWRKEDASFLRQSEEALTQGIEFINDMSESQVIQLIKEKKLPAITLWLKHNNPRYGAKLMSRTPPSQLILLTKDEENLLKKALALSSGTGTRQNHDKRNQTKRHTKNTTE